MKKTKILKAKIFDAEMDFEYPNRISILLNMIADSVKSVAEAEKIGIKIMELRDRFDEVKITIEEYPPKKNKKARFN